MGGTASPGAPATWQGIRDEVLRRIRARDWPPGARIPGEADLAIEFGCARATVNRALRDLADQGLIERRRKAGTRVSLHPVRKATLDIPVIRKEIEARGARYDFSLILREEAEPPARIRGRLHGAPGGACLHVTGLHLADGQPHAFEDRWIDIAAIPAARDADFSRCSPNEWLVQTIPFEGGDISFAAAPADAAMAQALECAEGDALFVTERRTWRDGRGLTTVRLTFAPGYRLHTGL